MATKYQRFRELRKALSLNQQELASFFGVDQSFISKVEKGETWLRLELLEKMRNTHNVNLDWLISGEGDMFRTRAVQEPSGRYDVSRDVRSSVEELRHRLSHPPVEIVYDMDKESDVRMIPMLDSRAAAGYPALYESRTFWDDLPTFPVPVNQARMGTYINIQVSGDSMYPTLQSGDWLFCKYLNDYSEVREGYIHIIVTKDGVVVKRVLNRLDENGNIFLKSDNPTYRTYAEHASNILQIWYVEWKLSYNLGNVTEDIYQRLNDHEVRLAKLESGKYNL
jgi:transcriptional regulator with XRE-family HTH domain